MRIFHYIFLYLLLISSYSFAEVIDQDLKNKFQTIGKKQQTIVPVLIFVQSNKHMLPIESLLKKLKGISYKKFQFMPLFAARLPISTTLLNQLASTPGISRISSIQPGTEESLLSTQSILLRPSAYYPDIHNWWEHGFNGKGQILGILDGGIAVEHPGLAGKEIIVRKEAGSHYDHYLNGVRSAHGTGVSCIYAGIGSSPFDEDKGAAFGVSKIVSGFAGDKDSEGNEKNGLDLTISSLDWMLTRAPYKPNIINYSFGNGPVGCENCPEWSGLAQIIDYVVNHYKILWAKSAGNNGWIAPSQKFPFNTQLTIPGDNYNALTVANMNHVVKAQAGEAETAERLLHQIRFTSSRGPTRYGRKKPDISAPGHYSRTCAPDENTYPFKYSKSMDYQEGYRLMGGTSSAAPHVGSAVLIFRSAGITEPVAVKALLINSADAWDDLGQPVSNEIKHHPVEGSLWNPTYGWGYLNMKKAFKQRKNIILSKLSSKNPEQHYTLSLPLGGKVTVVHERRVGYTAKGIPWRLTPLSLEIRDLKSNKLIMKDDSKMDTVHQVANCKRLKNERHCRQDVFAPKVMVIVKLTDTFIDGADAEPFALAYQQQ